MKTLIILALSIVLLTNIKVTVNDLVALHTRHNLSTKNDPNKGIGAAAKYLSNKLNGYIKQAGGRATVEKVEYRAGGKDTRLGREITLSNVIATFKSSNTDDTRIIALLAHYDSRSDNNSDSTTFAPGANENRNFCYNKINVSQRRRTWPFGSCIYGFNRKKRELEPYRGLE